MLSLLYKYAETRLMQQNMNFDRHFGSQYIYYVLLSIGPEFLDNINFVTYVYTVVILQPLCLLGIIILVAQKIIPSKSAKYC